MHRTITVAVLSAALVGCSSYRETGESYESEAARNAAEQQQKDAQLETMARTTMNDFRTRDRTIVPFFGESFGYAVFPKIAKGGAGVGAAAGDGVVYNNEGNVIGYARMSQGSIGIQLGGQSFSQIVFFENEGAFRSFRADDMEFSANASAVAAESGSGAAADYEEGVAVFVIPRGGLMFEAGIGGQKFDYRAK